MYAVSFKTFMSVLVALTLIYETCQLGVEATSCTPGTQSRFIGLKAPIKQVKSYHENPRNKFAITGTVEIVDGCKFVVKDFVFPSGLPATWYGKDQKEVEGYRVIQGVIAPSNGENKIFTLSDTPGSSYDWNDFDTLTIFYKDNVYAEAHFPELEPGSNFLSTQKGAGKPTGSAANSNVSSSQTSNEKKKMNNGENPKKPSNDGKATTGNGESHNGMHDEAGQTVNGPKDTSDGSKMPSSESGSTKTPGSTSGAQSVYGGSTANLFIATGGVMALTLLLGSGLVSL